MRRILLLLPLASVALALAAGPAPAASRPAYFKVKLRVDQEVSWRQDSSIKSCGSTVHSTGAGSARMHLATRRAQPAMARRVPGGHGVALSFARGATSFPIAGTVFRDGSVSHASSGSVPRECRGESIPMAPDCGTKTFPADTLIGAAYIQPEQWDYENVPTPLGPVLMLNGPWTESVDGGSATRFMNCFGVEGDNRIYGTLQSGYRTAHPAFALLPERKLFGRAGRFSVGGTTTRESQTWQPASGTGGRPTTTTVTWKMTFRRLGHRPPGL